MSRDKPKIYKRGKKKYFSREKKHNFLKNWRIVRYYIKRKYDLSSTELEVLLYLYDSDLFTKKEFVKIAHTINWQRSKFKEMTESGYIKMWREKQGHEAALYELTKKAKLICNQTYKKLTGEEVISEDPYQNELFKGANFQDKIYRQLIKQMNKKTKETLYT
tara:strand:+ start:35908 stop:36393 length:486 start_codon:yes stop_codon:yes gene_type:complete